MKWNGIRYAILAMIVLVWQTDVCVGSDGGITRIDTVRQSVRVHSGNLSGNLNINAGSQSIEQMGAYLWEDAEQHGAWRNSAWYGWFNDASFPWQYHVSHGWQYVEGENTSNIWTWDLGMTSWYWMSENFYPWMYLNSFTGDTDWIYYSPGSTQPERWFFISETNAWEREDSMTLLNRAAELVPDALLSIDATITVESSTEGLGSPYYVYYMPGELDGFYGRFEKVSPTTMKIYFDQGRFYGTQTFEFETATSGIFREDYDGWSAGVIEGSFELRAMEADRPDLDLVPEAVSSISFEKDVTYGEDFTLGKRTLEFPAGIFEHERYSYQKVSNIASVISYSLPSGVSFTMYLVFADEISGSYYGEWEDRFPESSGYEEGTFRVLDLQLP